MIMCKFVGFPYLLYSKYSPPQTIFQLLCPQVPVGGGLLLPQHLDEAVLPVLVLGVLQCRVLTFFEV